MDETRKLAHFIHEITYDGLPTKIIDKAKDLILDQFGCQLACSTLPWSKITYDYVKNTKGNREESTVVNYGLRTIAQDAAFANANFGHGFLVDDIDPVSNAHLGSSVIAAALAIGEKEAINGREFINSVVVGYDVALRIGAAAHLAVSRGFHPGPIFGPFGAAAVAAKILRLNESETVNALAIAGSHSSGLMEYAQSGGSVNRLHAGIAAYGGIRSSLLAQRGFSGPATVLEGNRGFCQAFSDRRFLDKITRNLGAEFRILEVEHKRYCCCGTQSAGLDAVSIIMHDHDITPKQIDEIIVSAPTPILKLTSTITDPEDITGAQLSRRFGIALRLVKGGNGFNEYNEKNLKDPEILSLAARIKYQPDDDLEKLFPSILPTKVTIRLFNGTAYTETVYSAKGSIQNPMPKEEIYSKFRNLGSIVMTNNAMETIIKTVAELEQIDNICDLSHLLVAA